MKRLFLIPSLLAAGLIPDTQAQVVPAGLATQPTSGDAPLYKVFRLDHRYTLASHRSHSSHSSHASHRSSTGGSYLYSPPTYTPPPTYVAPLVTLPGNTNKFKKIVMQVQLALIAYGYYTGEPSGVVDSDTRVAIRRLQTDYSLNVTGTITPQLLDALKITAE